MRWKATSARRRRSRAVVFVGPQDPRGKHLLVVADVLVTADHAEDQPGLVERLAPMREIVPCEGVMKDETPRPDTTLAKMATLEPLMPGSSLTAAVSSQTADAAAALLIVSEEALKRYQLKPRARIAHMSVMGDDPLWIDQGSRFGERFRPAPALVSAIAPG